MINRRSPIRTLATYIALVSGGMAALAIPPAAAQEADDYGWFARGWLGYSSLSDTDGAFDDTQTESSMTDVDVSTSGGFAAGGGIGYRYNRRIAAELGWEYRSNDSETDFASGMRFDDGNYASNTLFLNGYYHLGQRGRWDPYVGVGLLWLQEVDIDLEGNGPERSFSADGDFGVQVFAGSNYSISDSWAVFGEVRYGRVSGIDLDGENTPGTISDFDYEPLTLQLGLRYQF